MMKAGSAIILLFVFLVLQTTGRAQSFTWKARLETVPQTGFHRIPLSLDWLWRVKSDLSDVRIQNGEGVAVPLIVQQPGNLEETMFLDFPILRNTTDSSVTTIELDVSKKRGTDRIDLVMGNTAVERQASLSGSNDRRQSFIIDENLQLANTAGCTSGRFVQTIQFSFVQYRYLKLQIRNKGTDPRQVIKAGLFVDTITKAVLDMYLNPGTVYRQTDSSECHSYVWVYNQLPYPVDKFTCTHPVQNFTSGICRCTNWKKEKQENSFLKPVCVPAANLRSGRHR